MSEYDKQPFEPLDVDTIEAARRGKTIGHKVVVFKSTASTNDIAWQYAGKPVNHGLCVLAESQTQGRGRRGRTWHSRPGESILCSVLLLHSSLPAETLTLAAAVAGAEAIRMFCHLPCKIKWPNDLLIADKKVAGILVEKKAGLDAFVVGIGVNCNQEPDAFAEHRLNLPATSLRIETGQTIDRTALVCELLNRLEQWLDPARNSPPDNPDKSGEGARGVRADSRVIRRWLELSGMLGRRVTVECDGKMFSGTCRGLDPAQGLILQLDQGTVKFFPAAQTSLLESF